MSESITIARKSASLGLSAAWEIAALMQAVIQHGGQLTGDDNQAPLVVRGLAQRASSLASVLMEVLQPELGGTAAAWAQIVEGDDAMLAPPK
jgi:hypothetical protein